MLRSMERRNGWTHPGVVYAWAFEKANIVKWGHSVTTAEDRREYACLGVYRATGIREVPTLALEVEAAEPASLERYVIEHLPAPVYAREFFSLEHLPTIEHLVNA